jgi:divalent metal cation (Fe/Co/Zn/Cd) transporter
MSHLATCDLTDHDHDDPAGHDGGRAGHARAHDGPDHTGRSPASDARTEPADDEHHGHGHSHGLVDPSITRSRRGLRAVGISLAVLAATAAAQVVVFAATGSLALLADVIHNAGDALTAIPLAVAFVLRSRVAERRAGYVVVAAILLSALVAGGEAVHRLIDPRDVEHLAALAGAGLVGFVGNEIAARVRLRAGRRLDSAALVADGQHARADGYVSLSVIGSAAAVAVGVPVADPLIGLAMSAVILRITWRSWATVRAARRD